MKYWGEKADTHIRLCDTNVYQGYPCVSGKVNEHGYVDAPLGKSDVLYMGTCDIMSSVPVPEQRWVALLHNKKYSSLPFMTIGSSAAGLPSMVRRLHSYVSNYGAPKKLFLTVARFEGYEYVNKSGKCYNVNSRVGTPQFLKRREMLSDEEFSTWLLQVSNYKRLYNIQNNQYILEERFAFIETLCKAYGIEMQWTFNLSDACIVAMHRNISIFENISSFMKDAFVGLVNIEDDMPDRSMGLKTHNNIFNMFMNPCSWNFKQLAEQAENNFKWLEEKYPGNLIKNED